MIRNHLGKFFMKKILFVLKTRTVYNETTAYTDHLESGLFNSAKYVVTALSKEYDVKLVECIDSNFIDREIHAFKPEFVVIEAFWVPPAKLELLTKLHPSVTWIVRNHSDFPFLASEGIALDWMLEYLKSPKVYIAPNSIDTFYPTIDLVESVGYNKDRVIYLPNIYNCPSLREPTLVKEEGTIDIGCFGAIRPLKNQLSQAIAAIKFADVVKKPMNFHINAGRVEMNGNPILKNIRSIFAHQPKHKLVEHAWMKRHDFLGVVASMDIGMQVAYSETFNIVTADCVSQEVPSIVSEEVFWMPKHLYTDPNSIESMSNGLLRIYHHLFASHKMDKSERYNMQMWHRHALDKLEEYNDKSLQKWKRFLG